MGSRWQREGWGHPQGLPGICPRRASDTQWEALQVSLAAPAMPSPGPF